MIVVSRKLKLKRKLCKQNKLKLKGKLRIIVVLTTKYSYLVHYTVIQYIVRKLNKVIVVSRKLKLKRKLSKQNKLKLKGKLRIKLKLKLKLIHLMQN